MSKLRLIVNKINKNCDLAEFGEARRMIELNIQELQDPRYYILLNSNASVLLKSVAKQRSSNLKPLTRLEHFQIHEINKYSTEFDISMIKRTIKNCLDLLQRPDIDDYLNESAKTILVTMGAYIRKEREQAHS